MLTTRTKQLMLRWSLLVMILASGGLIAFHATNPPKMLYSNHDVQWADEQYFNLPFATPRLLDILLIVPVVCYLVYLHCNRTLLKRFIDRDDWAQGDDYLYVGGAVMFCYIITQFAVGFGLVVSLIGGAICGLLCAFGAVIDERPLLPLALMLCSIGMSCQLVAMTVFDGFVGALINAFVSGVSAFIVAFILYCVGHTLRFFMYQVEDKLIRREVEVTEQ